MSKRVTPSTLEDYRTLGDPAAALQVVETALATRDHRELMALQRALIESHGAHAEVHAVLDAQVKGAIETANSLVDAVVREANKTHLAAVGLVDFMAVANQQAEQAFASVKEAIELTNQERYELEEHAGMLAKASSATRRMLLEQKRLESIGENAHNLGMRIRIVAMNTTIQATQGGLGAGGGTIAVLAREISNLASEVQKVGLELKEAVHTLAIHLDRDVVNGVSEEAAATARISQTLARHVQSLRDAYGNLASFRENVWSQVISSSRQVSQHACDTLGGLQYQDIARQRLEQISLVLARIIMSDGALSAALLGEAPLPPEWSPVHAQELLVSYVMESQRRAHASMEAASTHDEGPSIELF
jgi:methyl-accepting chemotaxis protein